MRMAVARVIMKKEFLKQVELAGHYYAYLPGANALWHFAISVEESQSQLDDLQEVHIAPQKLQKIKSKDKLDDIQSRAVKDKRIQFEVNPMSIIFNESMHWNRISFPSLFT